MYDPNKMYDVIINKRNQLEREINESDALPWQKRDMQHSLSKLWMFTSDLIDTMNGKIKKDNSDIIDMRLTIGLLGNDIPTQ